MTYRAPAGTPARMVEVDLMQAVESLTVAASRCERELVARGADRAREAHGLMLGALQVLHRVHDVLLPTDPDESIRAELEGNGTTA